MEMEYTHRLITSADKLKENEVKFQDIIHNISYKKITVQKRTIKNKTYTSYLIGIPVTVISHIIHEFIKDDDPEMGHTVLEKIDNQTYKMSIVKEINPEMIILDKGQGHDIKNKVIKSTLPKKKIEYLQAYDKYLEMIEYINNKYDKEFEPAIITAFITINIAPADNTELQTEVLIRFNTNIDDKFINCMELLNDEIPDWLELLTSIPKEAIPSTFYYE